MKRIDFDEGCEECGIVEHLLDTITDGKAMRLCKRCAIANNSLILPKKKIEVSEKDAATELKEEKKSKEILTLNDLYERYKEIKARKMQETLHEEKFHEALERKKLEEMEEIKNAISQDIEFDFSIEKTKELKVKDLLKIASGRSKNGS
ncbi:MAG: hypothetical protein NZ889_02320 [Candidatus Pacearchaeota archaeon]|nr:hypothetical protein [Candidatus Pacearchaeota archaeon]